MNFKVTNNGFISWSNSLTVAGLIAKLGESSSIGIVKAICKAMSVPISVSSMLPIKGRVNKYFCDALISRHSTINGSKYAYTMTTKTICYDAYENADNNSTERAYINVDSKNITYSHGKSYYDSYNTQVQDAYKIFKQIGQKP